MANQFTSEWTQEIVQRMMELVEEHQLPKVTELINDEFQTNFTYHGLRGKYLRCKHSEHKEDWKPKENTDYKSSVEIGSDGTHKSTKLLEMSDEQQKDVLYLLDAHGYDINGWELVSARNNIWNAYSKQDGVQTLYSSKITVRPKRDNNFHKLLEKITQVKPIHIDIQPTLVQDKRLLENSLFDLHFPITTYEEYKETQAKIHNKITSRKWEEILFVVGSDLFHNDGFTSQTTKGTIIEKVDTEKAWEDATLFYIPLIEKALKQSNKTKIVYSPGNHDEAISWAFVKYLKALFPQCEYDDKLIEHKIHVFGDTVIGVTHGDKGKKELHNVFAALFPIEWGTAKNREIHTGHHHVEDARDKFGTMVRTLATKNKTDEWHKRHGYVGAHKRFMLFEYSETHLESIHYV